MIRRIKTYENSLRSTLNPSQKRFLGPIASKSYANYGAFYRPTESKSLRIGILLLPTLSLLLFKRKNQLPRAQKRSKNTLTKKDYSSYTKLIVF